MRRGPLLAALLCVAGALVVLVGSGNPWVVVDVIDSPLLPERAVDVTGDDLSPGVRALGLVGLAGVPALAATRGRGRIVVGLLLLGTGAAVVAVVLTMRLDDMGLGGRALLTDPVREAGGAQGESWELTAWSYATAFGGLVLAVAGLLIAAHGRRWSSLGRSYEPPTPAPSAAPAPTGERDLWEALDRGEDPTGRQDPADGAPQPRD